LDFLQGRPKELEITNLDKIFKLFSIKIILFCQKVFRSKLNRSQIKVNPAASGLTALTTPMSEVSFDPLLMDSSSCGIFWGPLLSPTNPPTLDFILASAQSGDSPTGPGQPAGASGAFHQVWSPSVPVWPSFISERACVCGIFLTFDPFTLNPRGWGWSVGTVHRQGMPPPARGGRLALYQPPLPKVRSVRCPARALRPTRRGSTPRSHQWRPASLAAAAGMVVLAPGRGESRPGPFPPALLTAGGSRSLPRISKLLAGRPLGVQLKTFRRPKTSPRRWRC